LPHRGLRNGRPGLGGSNPLSNACGRLANVELQPLFAWWTFAAQTTNPPLDLTEMDTNKFAEVSTSGCGCPPALCWIGSTSKPARTKIVVVGSGSMWKMEHDEPGPMMAKRQTIYLRNPPSRRFRISNSPAPPGALQSAQAKRWRRNRCGSSNLQARRRRCCRPIPRRPPPRPTPPPGFRPQFTARHRRDGLQLEQRRARTEARDRQLTTADAYLAAFPDKQCIGWIILHCALAR